MKKTSFPKRVAITMMAALMLTGTVATCNPCPVSANDGTGIYAEKSTITIKDLNKKATVTASSANVREGMSTSYRVVNTMKKGTKFTVTGETYRDGEKTDWYRVTIKDKDYGGTTTAYIHSSTFKFDSTKAAATTTKKAATAKTAAATTKKAATAKTTTCKFTVKAVSKTMKASSDVYVRKGPKATYDKLGALTKGTSVKVTGQVYKNGNKACWVKINYKKGTGYVCTDYLK